MPPIKKICVCSVKMPFLRGGAEIFFDNLVTKLQERDYEVDTIVLPLQIHPLEEVVKGCLAWRLLKLDSTLDADRIDLIIGTKFPSYLIPHSNKIIWLQHQHRDIYDLYGTKYSGIQNTPREIQLRHQIIELDQLAFGEAQKIFSQSKTVANRLKRHNGFDSAIVYPPLTDAHAFRFDAQEDFVLSVTRLAGNKRADLLIEAMPYVPEPFRAVVVGEGSQRLKYERLAESLGVSDRVFFTGKVSRQQVIDYYARAGVVFYGPIDEDYGYATLEAFYSRKPVITCNDSGGTLEFVDSSTGWISAPEPQAIAVCIQEALSRKQAARGRGQAGYEKISYISWDYVFDHLLGNAR